MFEVVGILTCYIICLFIVFGLIWLGFETFFAIKGWVSKVNSDIERIKKDIEILWEEKEQA